MYEQQSHYHQFVSPDRRTDAMINAISPEPSDRGIKRTTKLYHVRQSNIRIARPVNVGRLVSVSAL